MSDEKVLTFTISAHVWHASSSQVARAAEVLSRAAAGLALEGVKVMITVGPTEEDDDE